MGQVDFSISAQSKSKTETEVRTDGFRIIVDEPEKWGGTNKGPTPVDFVLAALAGCINVIGHSVARAMDYEIRDLQLEISGYLDSEAEHSGYQEINVNVDVDCDMNQDELQEWIEQVEKQCPVSDTISREVPINIDVS